MTIEALVASGDLREIDVETVASFLNQLEAKGDLLAFLKDCKAKDLIVYAKPELVDLARARIREDVTMEISGPPCRACP